MNNIIRMSAGLANRMFQYSYYLYLGKKGYNVLIDNLYKPTKWKMEDIEWERIFPNAKIPQASKEIIFLMGGAYDLFSKIRRHYLPFTTKVVMPKTFELVSEKNLKRGVYIAGAFQNAAMVSEIKDELQHYFAFSELTNKNKMIALEMCNSNSIAIHIRKGKDYLIRPDYAGTCDINYYNKAIDFIRSNVAGARFYIFSDNWDWVKDNIKNIDYVAVDWNPSVGWGNHLDMQLMSLCKHNITANSTYSWWGAFMNNNKEKIVISPNVWFNKDIKKYQGFEDKMIPQNWIRL